MERNWCSVYTTNKILFFQAHTNDMIVIYDIFISEHLVCATNHYICRKYGIDINIIHSSFWWNVYLDKHKKKMYSMKSNLGKNLVLGKNPIKSNNIQS